MASKSAAYELLDSVDPSTSSMVRLRPILSHMSLARTALSRPTWFPLGNHSLGPENPFGYLDWAISALAWARSYGSLELAFQQAPDFGMNELATSAFPAVARSTNTCRSSARLIACLTFRSSNGGRRTLTSMKKICCCGSKTTWPRASLCSAVTWLH